MAPYIGEFVGMTLVITLGTGVVANVVLSNTKGQNSGWIVITLGWAIFCGCVDMLVSPSGTRITAATSLW
jgi:glycerol uptake facilitator protein